MRTFIVSDHVSLSQRVRQALLGQGQDCPTEHAVPLQGAAGRLAQAQADLLVVVLPPDPDRSLALLSELQPASQARVLVVGPASNSRLLLKALRAGATDYIEEGELEAELPPALGRLSAGLPRRQEAGQTIVVLAPTGGSGSSTVAANIAAALGSKHGNVLLWDLKLTTGDLASLLDLQPTHTLADLCHHAGRMDRVMLERSLVRHRSGVQLLAAPRTFADMGTVTAEGIRQTLMLSRTLFPYVIIDLDHSFSDEQLGVLPLADTILLVLRLDFTSLRHSQRTLEYFQDHGVDRSRVQLVINRYGQPHEVPAAKAQEVLGISLVHYIPDEPKTVNRANNKGVPVVLESPSAKVSRSLIQLAASIQGKPSGR